jgi:hypothetical protein
MTATTASDALDARLAMEIRLLGLEARITGNSPYSESDALSGPGVRRGGGGESIDSEKTVMRRVHDIKQGIETAGEGSDSMKRFLANCASSNDRYDPQCPAGDHLQCRVDPDT